jgi:hypothetical protein
VRKKGQTRQVCIDLGEEPPCRDTWVGYRKTRTYWCLVNAENYVLKLKDVFRGSGKYKDKAALDTRYVRFEFAGDFEIDVVCRASSNDREARRGTSGLTALIINLANVKTITSRGFSDSGGTETARVHMWTSAIHSDTWHRVNPRLGLAFVPDHLIFGLRSSCERPEFMLTLVMRLTPVSMLAGTCSPFEAASAVLTPS